MAGEDYEPSTFLAGDSSSILTHLVILETEEVKGDQLSRWEDKKEVSQTSHCRRICSTRIVSSEFLSLER